ncbi:MAG: LysM peptidoglycan-binding domain-containing protein [Anaerolineae bacterium]
MKYSLIGSVFLIILGLTACNIAVPDVSPSPEILISDTPTLENTPTNMPTSSPTATEPMIDVPVIVASPLPTQDDLAIIPSNVTPIATQGPCEVTIREGEALTEALLRVPCGNEVNFGLIDAVVAFNENITNANLVSPGLTFFVPLPSPTPTPEGAELTATAAAERNISPDSAGLGSIFPANQEFDCYTVVEGDSVVSIANNFNTTLEVLSPLNPNLGWGGCVFTNPSGGPSCNPNLRIGECVTVPLPTSTPVPTSTPSGNETATPTPTHEPARIISPPEGATARQRTTLEWVSVGILQPDEIYLIDVEDRTTEISNSYVTYNTRYVLPDSLIPTDGQTHTIAWRVRVARINSDGTYTAIGGAGRWYTFQWQSR